MVVRARAGVCVCVIAFDFAEIVIYLTDFADSELAGTPGRRNTERYAAMSTIKCTRLSTVEPFAAVLITQRWVATSMRYWRFR